MHKAGQNVTGKNNIVAIMLMILLFVVHEIILYTRPEVIVVRSLIKFIIDAMPIAMIISKCTGMAVDKYVKMVIVALVTCGVGDILINYNDYLGMGIFMLAQSILIFTFIHGKPFSILRVITWLGVAGIIIGLCFSTNSVEGFDTLFIVCAIIYIFLVSAMFISAFGCRKIINIGAAFFFASDMLLIYNAIYGEPMLRHFIALGLYYIGVILIGLDIYEYMHDEALT